MSAQLEGGAVLHVCRPRIQGYLPRVHRIGARRYEVLGNPRRKLSTALAVLARTMAKDADGPRIYNRGDVLLCPDPMSYYEPTLMHELVRHG